MRTASLHQKFGFTLVELLVTVSILAILASTAIPALTQFLAQQSTQAQAHSVLRQLISARDFSISNNVRVSFCGIKNDITCTKTDIEAFAVFIDVNYNHIIDPEDTVLSYEAKSFNGSAKLFTGNSKHIAFNPNGYSRQMGRIEFCSSVSTHGSARKISVNRSGRVYLKRLEETQQATC